MEGVKSPSPEIQDCYLKSIFPNMLSNTSLDFISDMGVTDHRHDVDNIESKIENRKLQESFLKNRSLLEVSYFARNIYEIETVT